VVVPAAVLYRYRHRIGQWVIERQVQQTVEEGFGLEEAFDDAEPGEGGFDAPGTVGGGFGGPDIAQADPDTVGTVEEPPDGAGTVQDAATSGATVVESGTETGRCDCGELVSPRLDDACPNCGAPVLVE
jgi:hypothetical protein